MDYAGVIIDISFKDGVDPDAAQEEVERVLKALDVVSNVEVLDTT